MRKCFGVAILNSMWRIPRDSMFAVEVGTPVSLVLRVVNPRNLVQPFLLSSSMEASQLFKDVIYSLARATRDDEDS